jgi:hypothetical protein
MLKLSGGDSSINALSFSNDVSVEGKHGELK